MQVSNKIGYQETAGEYVGSKSILGPHMSIPLQHRVKSFDALAHGPNSLDPQLADMPWLWAKRAKLWMGNQQRQKKWAGRN